MLLSEAKSQPKVTTFPPNIAQGVAHFTTYTSENGLAMDAISGGHKSSICDSRGNIWFATQGGGVSRYDGHSFVSYGTEQGLANNYVRSIAEDKNGNLWFGTYGGGVSKYDGQSFVSYDIEQGLANNYVFSIVEDKNGNLWFGTDGGGVSKLVLSDAEGSDGYSFVTYGTDQGLAHNSVRSIAEDKSGNLWFGTYGGGVSKYDGNRAAEPCNNGRCKHDLGVQQDKKEHNQTLAKSFVNYDTDQGLAHNSVRCIAEDKSGNLWFGTYGGGVSKLVLSDVEGSNGHSFVNYGTDQGLANNYVRSIGEDKSGNLWFGTDAGGVSKYNGNLITPCHNNTCNHDIRKLQDLKQHENNLVKSFVSYGTDQGLANNSVRSITEDKIGNLWFGTYGGGVSKYDGQSFVSYGTDQGLANNSVFSIAEDKNGNLWFGADGGGVSKYDGQSFVSYGTDQGLANNYVRSIVEDKSGNIWFGTDGGGVSKLVLSDAEGFDGQFFVSYGTDQGLAHNSVRSIVEDRSGNLWFGTYGGVSKYDGQSFVTYTTDQGLGNNSIFSIAEDKSGNLWFGTDGGGVSKYDGKSFVSYTTDQGLSNNYVFSIAEDKSGNLWFGTEQGITIMLYGVESDSNNVDEVNMRDVTARLKNLPDKVMGALRFDAKGNLIIGTNYGMAVISAEDVERLISPSFGDPSSKGGEIKVEVYNQFTGDPIKDVNYGSNDGAMHIDSQGILWLGHGSNGVTRVDLDAINKSQEAPNAVINKVSLKGEDVCWYSLKSKVESSKFKEKSPMPEGAEALEVLEAKGRGGRYSQDSTIIAQQEIVTYGKVLSQSERDTLSKRFAGITFEGITKFYSLPENLVLPYVHNALTFEFNAIETGRNFLVNYQFALVEGASLREEHELNDEIVSSATLLRKDGMKIEWSPITKKHEATYNNLWEGEYTFLLKAQSPWGVWSESTEFTFTVLPPWYRTIWAYAIYFLLFAFSVWVVHQMQTKRWKERQAELEHEVEIATSEVREQKEHIEEAHKEITDSIDYAERIQRSFLATKEILDENLKDYFVLFKPKDVVSGDFYWADKLSNGDFAVVNADSTGHGVPGAIMSILNTSSIEEAVKEGSIEPAEIFNKARTFIIERLKKDGSKDGGKDGMDASIVCFNADKTKMTYTAAQNPIWIIRKKLKVESEKGQVYSETQKDESEKVKAKSNVKTFDFEIFNSVLYEIKPEKMPVGKHDNDHIPFVGGEFDLQKGDQVYTLTDGFQDQFGGPKRKKFMIKKMREYVLSISHLSMQEQHQKLDKVFVDWKSDLEQVDDVCVIGVRV
ncbi:MAG: SpoIIE family protein phosphatase [Flavobacteriales bacterium]|nr:SpoIIE family protein phosphatase [Flavobacteriales bacterium]